MAVYPGRHIASNPIPREWMPKIPKSANKAKACLWPEEDAKLARCAQVDLERRVAYGILTCEGMRASELASLKWRDLDLEHGRIRLDENKTDDPRAWALSPDVARTLAWWKKRTDGEDGDYVLRLALSQGPRWLRGKKWDPKTRHKEEIGDLRTAGITRSELFERTASRQPIRLHDLRATFVTVSLANGKTEQWVMDRTGHRSSQMIALYARQARTWGELNLGPLLPLDTLLPEMQREASRPGPLAPAASHPAAPRKERKLERPTERATAGRRARKDWATNGPRVAPAAGLEPATRRLTVEGGAAKGEESRDDGESEGSEGDDPDPACFAALQNDSSGIVKAVRVECITGVDERERAAQATPADVESAIRVAVKLAVEAGDYGCAKTLLELLERMGR